jgi:hypothetical protein
MIGFGKFEIEMIALGKIEAARKFEERSAKIFAARTGANKNKMKEISARIATHSTWHSSLADSKQRADFDMFSLPFTKYFRTVYPNKHKK